MTELLVTDVLEAKRDGRRLSPERIAAFIGSLESISDAQIAAFTMAVCCNGMDDQETAALTRAMLDSGRRLPRPARGREAELSATEPSDPGHHGFARVDKHSTGGIGDKVSLILAPLLASLGFRVPMISGRGLGVTGGTLDKLESIVGYHVDLSPAEIDAVLARAGCCIAAAGEQIAPADRRIYSIRDVTGTVPSVPLITASILSKKLAASLDALVMDVKVGRGAFMKTIDDARKLADTLIAVSRREGLPMAVFLTDMDSPLGGAVGNAVEVDEAIAILHGQRDGPAARTAELTVQLSAAAACLAHQDSSGTPGEISMPTWVDRCWQSLADGSAWKHFEAMIDAQGGRLDRWQSPANRHAIVADRSGIVRSIDPLTAGRFIVAHGGGRTRAGETIDHAVGLILDVVVGQRVRAGQVLVHVTGCDPGSEWMRQLNAMFDITPFGDEDSGDESSGGDEPSSGIRPVVLERRGDEAAMTAPVD